MIKATRVDNRIIAFIEGKLYEKEFLPQELLEVMGTLINIDENSREDLEAAKEMFVHDDAKTTYAVKESIDKVNMIKSKAYYHEFIQSLKEEENHSNDFYLQDDKLYLKPIPLSIPENIAVKMISCYEDKKEFSKIKNFWMLLALNPNARCREDLFRFLDKHDFVITPGGYFVAYRNVKEHTKGNQELLKAVIELHKKVRVWKKSPANYNVWKVKGQYVTIKDGQSPQDLTEAEKGMYDNHQLFGNLSELFNNSEKYTEAVYTDAHSGTTRITMGSPVSVPREECDTNPKNECSRGLHVARHNWLSRGYFGDCGIVVIVNPMHVVACPYADAGKLRTSEYLPIDFIKYDSEGSIIPISTEEAEIEYSEHTIEELESFIKERKGQITDTGNHTVYGDEYSWEEVQRILRERTLSLEDMKSKLANKLETV